MRRSWGRSTPADAPNFEHEGHTRVANRYWNRGRLGPLLRLDQIETCLRNQPVGKLTHRPLKS